MADQRKKAKKKEPKKKSKKESLALPCLKSCQVKGQGLAWLSFGKDFYAN